MRKQKVIDLRFILTPIATTQWTVDNVRRFRVYFFGFKIADFVN